MLCQALELQIWQILLISKQIYFEQEAFAPEMLIAIPFNSKLQFKATKV
jgi:hypothetical protein